MLGKLVLYTDNIAVLIAESNTLKINQSFLFCWHYCYLNCWLLLFTSAHLYHLLVIKAQQYWLNKDGLMASIVIPVFPCPHFSFSLTHTHTILNIQYRSSTVYTCNYYCFYLIKQRRCCPHSISVALNIDWTISTQVALICYKQW